ncbi:hypothetical protein HY989_03870 [Candidatus Micrarchaeota archaeon]|nr:hypothetical protein [Candidatus Micrarchaeota archaeon]
MRGILFSTDAVLALLVSMLFIGYIFHSLSLIESAKPRMESLQKISGDFLQILEEDGSLKMSMESNSDIPIVNDGRILPSNLCYELILTSKDSQSPLISSSNCACKDFVLSRRSFIASNGTAQAEHFAELKTCYK